MFLPQNVLEEKLRKMLAEDLGQGDVTTALVVPAQSMAEAHVIAKEAGIVAGMEETEILLKSVGLNVEMLASDGDAIKKKQVLMKISGNARVLISVERTLLNIVSRMSGIATTTRKLADKLAKAKLKTKVACTRKTAPGLLYCDWSSDVCSSDLRWRRPSQASSRRLGVVEG
jgi:nicotinate-nucleotide pyrophosphorylase (carboxylating)